MILRLLIAAIITIVGTSGLPSEFVDPDSVALYSEGFSGQGVAGSNDPVVYLTFDDGSDGTYTPRVMDLPYDSDAYVPFFVLGQAAEYYPDLIQRMVDDGHTVANHTWLHP